MRVKFPDLLTYPPFMKFELPDESDFYREEKACFGLTKPFDFLGKNTESPQICIQAVFSL